MPSAVSPSNTSGYQWRSDSRGGYESSDKGSRAASVVQDTLDALVDDVKATTEVLRRKHFDTTVERRGFIAEMEVTGRISISPTDWTEIHRKSKSDEMLNNELGNVMDSQRKNAVVDTLAALVYDVNATAEVLRRGSLKRKKKPVAEEVEYRLRITPAPEEPAPFPATRPSEQPPDDMFTLQHVSRDYGVEMTESQTSSLKRRARSETPRRMINVEGSPPPGATPICAFCSEEIEGAVLTALAPNSVRAQKFHTYHFMCTYCQKALNLRGTYREHQRKPYCHECFYKLYNGLIYEPDEKQRMIEKLC